MKSEVFGSAITELQKQVDQLRAGDGAAITELQEAVDRLTGQYINLMTRVRELEDIAHPPAATKAAAAPEIITLPSGWAIIRSIPPITGCPKVQEIFGATVGLMTILAAGHESYREDIAKSVSWFASERDAETVVDLLGLRDVRVARLYRDTLGEVT